MSSSASSDSSQIIINVVFGLTATAISIVTVWQGHKAWKLWREHAHGQEHARGQEHMAHDLEVGLQTLSATPTNLETPEPDGVVAASAPSANQIGGVAGSEHVPVSVQGSELPSPVPAAIDVETGRSPGSVQGTQMVDEGRSNVRTDDTRATETETEGLAASGEL